MLKQFYQLFVESYVQTFSDKKDGDSSLIRMFPMREIKDRWKELHDLNARGAGVYFTPNPCEGGRKEENLTGIEWVFVDMDDGTKDEMMTRINSTPVMPDMIVESNNGYHLYWKLKCDKDEFRAVVRGLIKFFNGDEACKDPNRVLRIPGFKHMKGEPYMINIQHLDIQEHTVPEMIKAFPAPKEEAVVVSSDDDDIRTIKEIPVKEILSQFGVQWNHQNEIVDNGKATSAVINVRENYVKRFSGKDGSGSTIDVAMAYGCMNKPEAIKWLKEYCGIEEKKSVKRVEKALKQDIKRDIEKRYTWGTTKMNHGMAVIKPHHYTVLVGQQGDGKTTFCFFQGRANAKLGHKVLFLSLEMDTNELISDIARRFAGITIEEEFNNSIPQRKQDAFKRKHDEVKNLENFKLQGVNRGDGIFWADIQKIIEQEQPDLVYVDNLNAISKKPNQTENDKQAEVSQSIMSFTNEKQIPVVLLHHYRKKSTGESSKMRSMDAVEGSSRITKDADLVVHIIRNTEEEATELEKRETKVWLEKARGYSPAMKTLYFDRGDYRDDIPNDIQDKSQKLMAQANNTWYNK